MKNHSDPLRPSAWAAVADLFFNLPSCVRSAHLWRLATELEHNQQARGLYMAGAWPTAALVNSWQEQDETFLKALRTQSLVTLVQAAFLLVASIGIALLNGMPVANTAKYWGVSGAFWAACGAILQFRAPEKSWKGRRLDEVLRTGIVGATVVIGAVCGLVATLIAA